MSVYVKTGKRFLFVKHPCTFSKVESNWSGSFMSISNKGYMNMIPNWVMLDPHYGRAYFNYTDLTPDLYGCSIYVIKYLPFGQYLSTPAG